MSTRTWRGGDAPVRRRLSVLATVVALCAPVLPVVALTAQPAAAAVGQITTYPGISAPFGITAGPDGALWFTNRNNSSIGRITTSGAVTGFNDPGIAYPDAITAGPDGALWFTNGDVPSIGRITTAGVVTSFPLAAGM